MSLSELPSRAQNESRACFWQIEFRTTRLVACFLLHSSSSDTNTSSACLSLLSIIHGLSSVCVESLQCVIRQAAPAFIQSLFASERPLILLHFQLLKQRPEPLPPPAIPHTDFHRRPNGNIISDGCCNQPDDIRHWQHAALGLMTLIILFVTLKINQLL